MKTHDSQLACSMIYPACSKALRLLFITSMIYLAGCASQPQVVYRTADVPEPPVITRPELESVNITSAMDPGTILQALRSDIKKLQATILEYEKALGAYRKKDTK